MACMPSVVTQTVAVLSETWPRFSCAICTDMPDAMAWLARMPVPVGTGFLGPPCCLEFAGRAQPAGTACKEPLHVRIQRRGLFIRSRSIAMSTMPPLLRPRGKAYKRPSSVRRPNGKSSNWRSLLRFTEPDSAMPSRPRIQRIRVRCAKLACAPKTGRWQGLVRSVKRPEAGAERRPRH